MLLSARILNNVEGVNAFEVVPSLEVVQGDAPDIYLALIDASCDKRFDPPGRRYVPRAGATLKVVLQDINTAVTMTTYATQPFSGDKSIWKVAFNPTVNAASIAGLAGTYALKLTLVEPGTTMPAAWDTGTIYDLDSLVSYSGGIFRSLQNTNLAQVPGADDFWWEQMHTTYTRTLSGFVQQAVSVSRASPEF
jgi:hypothetical protein